MADPHTLPLTQRSLKKQAVACISTNRMRGYAINPIYGWHKL